MDERVALAHWLGSQYNVALRDPPGHVVQGTLVSLVPLDGLVLDSARILNTGQLFPQLRIPATNVLDIGPSSSNNVPVPGPIPHFPHFPQIPPPYQTGFQDPAILSAAPRPDSSSHPHERHYAQPNVAEKRDPPAIPNPADHLTYSSPDEVTDAAGPNALRVSANSESVSHSKAVVKAAAAVLEGVPNPKRGRGPGTRGRGRRRERQVASNGSPIEMRRGPGWRETPILESTASFQPFTSLKKSQKSRADANADNEWASEDVTDVQEAGDFDFEGGLAKFDKRKVFEEMKAQDEIEDAQRLVSHNRLPRPKPGTAGGKNLHYTENVLDVPSIHSKGKAPAGDYWKSEADDEPSKGADHSGSGRSSRLRGDSRLSTSRRSQSRKASTAASVGGSSRVNSGVSVSLRHNHSLLLSSSHQSHQLTGPSPQSTSIPGGFYAVKTNRRIEAIAHLPMQTLENVARHEFGFTEDLMAENAGRGITEVVLLALDDPAIKLRAAATSPPTTPTIVVLAGNNKSGARALAAARHLRNRGLNVLVCVVGIERERELLEDIKKQTRLLRNFGGAIFTKSELFDHVSHASTTLATASQGSVTLIIDALLGLTTPFEELRKSDQATTYELMEWSNRNEAFVMAIDLPSGIEPQTGKVNVIDGAKLYVHPRYVVALGAPKLGLLKALEMGDEHGDTVMVEQWKLFLADIGLSPVIWRKVATKIRRGIEFDNNWVLELRYQPQTNEGDE
ncbi:YjeF N-terminal domain-like protein [Hypoxylon sp. FL0543]|nr:YjeF N-terminal domain-like protein [Hypoxylon sp. FL0543]